MTVEIIKGVVRSDLPNQDRKPISMEAFATKLDDEAAFFMKMLQAISGIRTVGRMETKHRESRLVPIIHTTTAAFTSGGTSLSMTNAGFLNDDDVLYIPSLRKYLSVADATIAATDTAVGVRKIDTASSTGPDFNIASGVVVQNLGESHAEGEAIPAARQGKQTTVTTRLYQKDETVKHTDIEINEDEYGQSKLDDDREQSMIQYLRQLALMFYGGLNIRESLSADGPIRGIPAGLEYYLYSSGVDAGALTGGGLTMASLGEILRLTYAHTSAGRKTIISGSNGHALISSLAKNFVRIEPGEDKSWGVTVNRLVTPFGNADIGYDPVLSPEYGLADRMFILDLNKKHIGQLQLKGLPLIMKRNVNAAADIHNVIDVITGTRGFFLKLVELHREVFNVH